MNFFVTGATGILGRGVVRQLAQQGHKVSALSRSDANEAQLRKLGVEPSVVSLNDPTTLKKTLTGVDVVLHLATKIPNLANIGKRKAWLETDHLRRDGTRSLVDAALASDVQTLIYPSIVFLYPDGGQSWLEADTTPPQPADYLITTLDAEREVARFAASKPDARGITLRMGGFYSPESEQTLEMLRFAKHGISPTFGHDNGFVPTLWVDDASSAVVAAVNAAPTGVFDVVDDEPLTRVEHRVMLGRIVGRSRLWRIPDLLSPLVLGVTADTLTRSQRVSNAKFKATGWTPTMKCARDGWASIALNLGLELK
jgi:2-alkyl-3-oxoalkanoate reductase